MKKVFVITLACLTLGFAPVLGQLLTGHSDKTVNFREGPGMNFNVSNTIDNSNLLVILPGQAVNGFVEVFDVETSSRGYVYKTLISYGDTLLPQNQFFFEKSEENAQGEIELILINGTNKSLFFWINNLAYDLLPHEQKALIFQDENITYFSSVPGVFPIYGKEILKKGYSYRWSFSF